MRISVSNCKKMILFIFSKPQTDKPTKLTTSEQFLLSFEFAKKSGAAKAESINGKA